MSTFKYLLEQEFTMTSLKRDEEVLNKWHAVFKHESLYTSYVTFFIDDYLELVGIIKQYIVAR